MPLSSHNLNNYSSIQERNQQSLMVMQQAQNTPPFQHQVLRKSL
jgi:hypothetical protein